MNLTSENYTKGFLVDEEMIAGVTKMGDARDSIFAAYVSHYLTGETLSYREFDKVEDALAFLATLNRPWVFEGVGCSKSSGSSGAAKNRCGSGTCSSCAC